MPKVILVFLFYYTNRRFRPLFSLTFFCEYSLVISLYMQPTDKQEYTNPLRTTVGHTSGHPFIVYLELKKKQEKNSL